MSVEYAIRQLLLANLTIAAASARIVPKTASMGDPKPFCIYNRVGYQPDHHLRGKNSGRALVRVQLDWFAASYTQVMNLGTATRAALDGFAGTVVVDGMPVVLHTLWQEDERDEYVPPTDASDIGIYRLSMDFACSATVAINAPA